MVPSGILFGLFRGPPYMSFPGQVVVRHGIHAQWKHKLIAKVASTPGKPGLGFRVLGMRFWVSSGYYLTHLGPGCSCGRAQHLSEACWTLFVLLLGLIVWLWHSRPPNSHQVGWAPYITDTISPPLDRRRTWLCFRAKRFGNVTQVLQAQKLFVNA